MEMKEMNQEDVCNILNSIMEYELAGVVRYTHSSLMVTGPYRLPIVTFLKEQASESLLHAQQAGELIVGLDGHPSQKVARIEETNRHTIKDILEEALEHELHALSLYKKLLTSVADASVYLEEYARSMICEEEHHSLELKAMLKDFGKFLGSRFFNYSLKFSSLMHLGDDIAPTDQITTYKKLRESGPIRNVG